jgi:DNA-3-methyladenine glycosylase
MMETAWADPVSLRDLKRSSAVLSRAFYERPTVEVARALLGKVLVHGDTAGRIVEVEAYLGGEDEAAHASRGVTERTRVIFGPAGYAYVYFIYGQYECLNVVAEPAGRPGCVLIRALEPLAGIETMRARRPGVRHLRDLASGPGKLTLALDITRRHYGCDLTSGPLLIRAPKQPEPVEIEVSHRIGVRRCADWPLRFTVAGSAFVSRAG